MKTPSALAVAAVVAAAAVSAATDESPYIPESGVSTQCHDFLVSLDSNADLAACSNSLLAATSLFSPTSTSASTASDTQIKTALAALCSDSTQAKCSDALVKQQLTWFSGNCSTELAAGNALVKSNYDVLYVLSPFTDAVCSQDESGNYCALEIGTPSSSSSDSSAASSGAAAPSGAQKLVAQTYQGPHIKISDLYVSISSAAASSVKRLAKKAYAAVNPNLSARQANATTASVTASTASGSVLMPNATTFRTSNLPFLFISADMTSDVLCTSCTKAVLASYVAFETSFPYSTGLSNSPILGGQADLWKNIGTTCGSGFLSSVTSQAGGSVVSGAGKTAAVSSAAVLAGTLIALFAL